MIAAKGSYSTRIPRLMARIFGNTRPETRALVKFILTESRKPGSNLMPRGMENGAIVQKAFGGLVVRTTRA